MWSKRQPGRCGDITKDRDDGGEDGVRDLVLHGQKIASFDREARYVYFWCLSPGVALALHYVGAAGLLCQLLAGNCIFAQRGR